MEFRHSPFASARHRVAALVVGWFVASICAAAPAGLQVEPVWQAKADALVPHASALQALQIDALEDGTLVAVAQDDRGSVASLRVDASGARIDGQWGARAQGGRPVLQRLLAADASGALLRVREPLQSSASPGLRDITALLDPAGNRRWALPFAGTWGRFLANGDVLLATEVFLLRLRATDGVTIWAVPLAALTDAGEGRPDTTFTVGEDSVTAVVRTDRQAFTGDVTIVRIAAFDLASGALRWSRVRAPALDGTRLCGIQSRGDRALVAWITGAANPGTLLLEQYRATDGAIVSSAPGIVVPNNDASCLIVDRNGDSVVATRDDDGATVLVGVDAAGAVRWRQDAVPGFYVSLARLGASGDVARVSSAGDVLRVERYRGSDGQRLWDSSLALDAPLVAAARAAAVGSDVRVAVPFANGVRLLRFDGATGVAQAPVEVRPAPVVAPGSTAAFVDGVPYLAQIVLRGPDPELSVRRLRPDTGTLAWESNQGLPTGIALPASSVTIVAAGASTVLVSVSAPSDAAAAVRRSVLLALSAADGSVVWRQDLVDRQDVGEFTTPDVLAAGDSGLLVRRKACGSASDCADATPSYEWRSLASGAVAWSQPRYAWSAALVSTGVVAFYPQPAGARTLVLHDVADGRPLWSQDIEPFWEGAGAIAEISGGLLSSYSISQTGFGGLQRSVRLERRELSSGATPWTFDRGPAPNGFRTAMLSRAGAADVILTAGRSFGGPSPRTAPYLERVDGLSGNPAWVVAPPLPTTGLWTLRTFGSANGTLQGLRSIRQPNPAPGIVDERWFVGAIDLGTGAVGGEHLLFRRWDDVLGNPATLRLAHRFDDGAIGLVDFTVDGRGHQAPTISRIPAPDGPDVDIVVRVVDGVNAFTGLGPSARVEIEVENASPVSVEGIQIGADSRRNALEVDGLPVRLVFCQVPGGSVCPTSLNGLTGARLSLGAGAIGRLAFDVLDPQFRHGRNGAGSALGLLIHAEAPYAVGDTAPENNVVEVFVQTGGFADGFD